LLLVGVEVVVRLVEAVVLVDLERVQDWQLPQGRLTRLPLGREGRGPFSMLIEVQTVLIRLLLAHQLPKIRLVQVQTLLKHTGVAAVEPMMA
jgi:hypothetical protein